MGGTVEVRDWIVISPPGLTDFSMGRVLLRAGVKVFRARLTTNALPQRQR
jgi:hypothetical protein